MHEKSAGGMPFMPGSRVMGRRNLYLTDDRGGVGLQGETEAGVHLPFSGKTGKGFTGYALPNPERCGERSFSTGEKRGIWGK